MDLRHVFQQKLNKPPKLIRFQIALQLPFDAIIKLSGTNKVWYGTQLESTFLISKINRDFPERILPYKNSDFKSIYHTELRRQVLLDKFHFDSKIPNLIWIMIWSMIPLFWAAFGGPWTTGP